ncbi:MAG: ABC transporter permease, partial [Anaerolineaceae bacterium]|nr:ABC transporter permease [Anaerolineaceae bacterium]
FWDMAYHMVLPIVTLMMLSIGGLMRYTRTNMLEVLNSDYIRTARAKGLSEKVVVNKHAFRNTLIPLVSYMSYLLPAMFGGALITETLYQIPGIGFVAYQAIIRGDIPFAMFYTTFQIILTQVSLLIADIMYAVVDPRVRVN